MEKFITMKPLKPEDQEFLERIFGPSRLIEMIKNPGPIKVHHADTSDKREEPKGGRFGLNIVIIDHESEDEREVSLISSDVEEVVDNLNQSIEYVKKKGESNER